MPTAPRPPPAAVPAIAADSRTVVGLAGLLLAVAVVMAWHNSFAGPFVFDDIPSIVENGALDSWWTALSPQPDGGLTGAGRPVVNLTFAFNRAWTGSAVWSWHVVNLAIHLAAALVLFGVARRALGFMDAQAGTRRPRRVWLAAAVALLWAVHPLQTESVTYLVQRAESLAGLFSLLALYGFVRGVRAECPRRWFVAAVAACLLGMATKETAAPAPLVVLLFDRAFVAGSFREAWRRRWPVHVAMMATWIPLVALVAGTGNRGGTAGFGSGIGAASYALTQAGAVVHYLRLAAWPRPLVLDYGTGVAGGLGDVWPALAVLLGLEAATAWALVRRPALGWIGAWFFLWLAPSSSVVPVTTQTMAEHRVYLALAAPAALLVLALDRLAGRRGLIAAGALAAVLGVVTIRRNADYRNAVALWTANREARPGNPRSHSGLGDALKAEGRFAEAERAYLEARRLAPADVRIRLAYVRFLADTGRREESFALFEETARTGWMPFEAHVNYGNAVLDRGRPGEAIAHLRTAVALRPRSFEAHFDLGNAYWFTGDRPAALAEFDGALRLRPESVEARCNRSAVLLEEGRAAEAAAEARRVLARNAAVPEAHLALGSALAALGRTGEAAASYGEAIRSRPDFGAAHAKAGELLAAAGRPAEGIKEMETAVRLVPGNAEWRFALARALAENGRLEAAAAHFAEVVRAIPESAAARNNFGAVLARLGRMREARDEFAEAVRLEPGAADLRENLGRAEAALREAGGSAPDGSR